METTTRRPPRAPSMTDVVRALATCAFFCALCAPALADPKDYFAIQMIDEQTNRGLPLVELETTDHVKLYTDSAGMIAFNEPGLMNETVFFTIAAHGYEFPADGFGIRGKALVTMPGTSA